MQKKLYFVILNALFTSIAMGATTPFNGFYGNGALGLSSAHMKDDQAINMLVIATGISTPMPNTFQNLKSHPSDTIMKGSVSGGFGLGFSKTVKNSFLYGLEGRANFENMNASFESLDSDKSPSTTDSPGVMATLYRQGQLQLKNDFDLLVKLGVLLHPNTLFYGLIGAAWGNFEVSSDASFSENIGTFLMMNGSLESNESSYQTGLMFGVGMEYLISHHFSLALEYTHTNYGNLDLTQIETAPLEVSGRLASHINSATLSFTNKFNAQTDNVSLRVTYYLT